MLFDVFVFRPDRLGILDAPETFLLGLYRPFDSLFRRPRKIDLQVSGLRNEIALQ